MSEILGIIADDLTGAGDSVVQFASAGIPGVVAFGTAFPLEQARVIALDTDSRGLAADEARQAVAEAVRQLRSLGATHLYKKGDSTLRGNLAAELDALMDEAGMELALVAPAYPANGRITAGGFHLVRQVPVAESEAARDPVSPVHESHLPTLLSTGCSRKVGVLTLAVLHKGAAAVSREIARLKEQGITVIACDATTEEHLAILAEYLWDHPKAVGCGSPGLAGALAQCMSRRDAVTISAAGKALRTGHTSGPVLIVAGSRSQVTAEQIEEFRGSGVGRVEADPETMLGAGWTVYAADLAAQAARHLESGRDTLVFLSTSAKAQERPGDSQRLADALGEIAGTIVRAYPAMGGLVLTGGDTAKAVCRALRIDAIELVEELAPAVPVGILRGGLCPGLPVITKGGGCGNPRILITAADHVKKGGADRCDE